MPVSRNLYDLAPGMREKASAALDAWANDAWLQRNGIVILVTCTFRPKAEQALLYAQGRTREQLDAVGLTDVQPRPGPIVTWALPGLSAHNKVNEQGRPAAEGMDIVPLRHGKAIWGTSGNGLDDDPTDDATDDLEVWQRVGEIGKRVGLEWAGDWKKPKREFPHFQSKGQ